MPELHNLTIKIKHKDDETSPYPEYDDAKGVTLEGVLIIEGATGRGRTGVAFYGRDDQGNKYYFNTTARMIVNGIAAATRGAMERFNDNPNEA